MRKVIGVVMALSAAVFLMGGCTTTSGVLPVGNGNFTVTTGASPGAGGLSESKKIAYSEASAYCDKQGKKIAVVNESSIPMSFWGDGKANTSIQFKCE